MGERLRSAGRAVDRLLFGEPEADGSFWDERRRPAYVVSGGAPVGQPKHSMREILDAIKEGETD